MKRISINPAYSKSGVLSILLTVTLLAFVWTGFSGIGERVITVRYFLFALVALVAFLTPYILFPDRNVSILQLGNFSGLRIKKYILEKIWRLAWPIYLLIPFMYFGDLQTPFDSLLEKLTYTVSSLSVFSGVLLLSIVRYVKSGESSQFWKEAEKEERQDHFSFFLKYNQIDPSALPSLLNTILVFSVGAVSLVIGAVLQQQFSFLAEGVFYFIILLSGLFFFITRTHSVDRSFYLTDAFFHEFFGVSLKGEELTVKREVEQLWWVPSRIKMHVWQFLLQLDRKIPAGRAVAAGHAAVWFIAYQRPEPQFLTIIWILFGVLHQLFTLMSIQQQMAPYWMLRWVDDTRIWALSRFWMQFRWLVPLLLSMNVQYFIFGVPGFYEQGIVIAIFLISALLTSLFGTMKLKQDLKT